MRTLYLLPLALILTSCGWTDNQQEAYMNECEKGMQRGFESSGGEPPSATYIHDVCACSFEKVKEKWSYTEFIELTSEETGLQDIMEKCAEDL